MKCFYHTDVDGKCAGAIVRNVLRNQEDDGTGFSYIPISYKDDFPFESIQQNEEVFIVDFSLQKEDEFERLRQITNNIIWIDHHKSAIEKHLDMADLKGIRDISKAGCELTWEYFYPDVSMPLAVKYAGRYDVWDFSEYGEELNKFQAGIRLREHCPESDTWVSLLKENIVFLGCIIRDGAIALQFRTNRYKSIIKAFSFYAEFEGYKAICCNVGSTSSQLFDSVDKETYDLMMPFVFDGKQWTVSIYSTKDIDCSELAKKYGGGGHKGAAGFQCKELPFKKEEKI